ncbi:uncharacterized protein LOC134260350 [Saccostrea cucullata]|uniref:uncharacterized protein LOC134260350 n=1 Tax=Saccostrea cuccullata TaxID=36930 RepID=UPI002ED63F62
MYKILTILGVALAAFLFFEFGNAIQCYQCNSYFQQDCADYFNNHSHALVDCGENVTMCRKIVQEVYYNDEWNVRYIRQCAPSGEIGDDEGRVCKERTGTYRVKMKYCHCGNQKGCNSATSIQLSLLMMLLPVVAAIKSQFSHLL